MCTAACLLKKDFAFGRTLDYDFSYGEQVVVAPRNYPFSFKMISAMNSHYAMVGMAHVADDFPLYYDAINEHGLAMAGLNFVGNAVYGTQTSKNITICPHEFIPYILGKCKTLKEAWNAVENINLANISFSEKYPISQLHWIIADKTGAFTVESTSKGLFIYENPVGVLTNNPEFPAQLASLADIAMLSPKELRNNCIPSMVLEQYSRGLGAKGLPGDWSSMSRFKRCVFARENAIYNNSDDVTQLFHILDTVSIPRGVCQMDHGACHITQYTSVCHKGVYYYTRYNNHQISAVDMHRENLDNTALIKYNLIDTQQVYYHN